MAASTRRIMRSFKMDEISAVTKPAQEPALATIMKRHDPAADLAAILKAIGPDEADGAQSFSDLLAESEERQRQYEASEELWPLFCALQDSIRSIAADASLSTDGKLAAIQTSIDEFAATVRERFPDMEGEIEKMFHRDPLKGLAKAVRIPGGDHVGTKEKPMTDITKKVADLESQNADLQKKLDTALAAIEKAKQDEITKNDETIEVGGKTLRKSVLGDEAFAALKTQQGEVAKARDEAELAAFTKTAETEFGNLPGEAVAKAKVLRAVSKMDAESKAELEKMLKAGNAALKAGFVPLGQDGGGDFAKAEDELEAMAKVHAETHKVSIIKARVDVLDTPRGRQLYAQTRKPKAA